MGIINLIIFGITLIIGVISLFSYYDDKGEMKETQISILENISPKRTLSQKEVTRLKELYKINLELNTLVYSVRGSLSYISLETNGVGQKEWLVGDILIAPKSIKFLKKKGVSLDEYIYEDNDFEAKIELINKKLEKDEITEEEALKEAQEIYETNEINFVLANPLKKDKPVYLLSYTNDKIDSPINLLS